MTSLPPIGAPIALHDEDGGLYPSRMEGNDDDALTVARPSGLFASVSYRDGMHFDLSWTMDTGIYVLPVVLVGTSTDGVVRLWHLEPTGEVWTQQRRDYVRVPLVGLIRMTPIVDEVRPDSRTPAGLPEGADLDTEFEGGFVDLSEVAAQCSVHLSMRDPRIAVGTQLRCRFAIAGDDFDIVGAVAILRAGATPNESRIVVRFDHSEVAASALRRHVFRVQLEMRRERQQSEPSH